MLSLSYPFFITVSVELVSSENSDIVEKEVGLAEIAFIILFHVYSFSGGA